MRRRHSLGLALAGAALLAAPRVGAAQQPDFRWHGALAAGRTVEIKGINGRITAEGSSGREVEVEAVKRGGRRGDAEEVQIVAVTHEDGVTICALYPTPRGRPENTCAPGREGHSSNENNETEVDFTVRVPQGVRFAGATVNGGVRATGLTADAEARTVNGGVTVETRGTAEAQTVNGRVDVVMGRADWSGPVHLATVNGGITVTLPASADVDVRAQTVGGDLDSDFPMIVKGRWGPRRMSGTIGKGGRTLELETVNGSIEIRRGR
jgi:Putative adhesin